MMAELGLPRQLIVSSSAGAEGPVTQAMLKEGGVSGAEFGAGREQGPRG